MVYLNHEFYEMTPWYGHYSKTIKAFALTRETIALQVENAIIQKLWKWPLHKVNIKNNYSYKFMQNDVLKYLIREKRPKYLLPIRFK